MTMTSSFIVIIVCTLVVFGIAEAGFDYKEALTKSIVFYEAQRSGKLPPTQRVTWRGDSGLRDGNANGIDLTGGYYDAGDNVKFGLPMAYTVTMLAWSVIEYRDQLSDSGELDNALDAIKWGTDYLLKAHPQPDVLYGQVGDGTSDHYCWQRPEDMTTSRYAYKIDSTNPGSDLAGETAAAMAAAFMVFMNSNPNYSSVLLTHAKQLFWFANKYRGKYDSSITNVQKFYGSISGYEDELLWAAAWLHRTTGDKKYLSYLIENAVTMGGTEWTMTQFSWDNKYAGVQVLASMFLMQGKGGKQKAVLEQYQKKAEFFMCSCLQKNGYSVQRTPGGLLHWQKWNNMHFVTSASFLLTVYSDFLSSAGKNLQCPYENAQPSELLTLAKSQVDYVLGNNPRATSYMVGYGPNYPGQVHHRAASIVSYKANPSFVTCKGGYDSWFSRQGRDPNVLVGAIVGGPDENDNFADERDNYAQTEPTTYNNAPMVGTLARLQYGNADNNQLQQDNVILPETGSNPQLEKLKLPVPEQGSPPPTLPQDNNLVAITQKVTHSWSAKGAIYYRYSLEITNKSPYQRVTRLDLYIEGLYGPIWGLSRVDNNKMYTFPTWLKSLLPRQSMEVVYIQAAPQAIVKIANYQIG